MRRKYPSRYKFIPYLTVYCLRTEEWGSLTGTAAPPIVPGTLCDLYYDNVIYLCHFDQPTESYSVASGGYTYLKTEVYPDVSSSTYQPTAIPYWGNDAGVAAALRYPDPINYKFGTYSLHIDGSATAANGYGSHIRLNTNVDYIDITEDLDFTTSRQFTLEFWWRLDPIQRTSNNCLVSYDTWVVYNGNEPCWQVFIDNGSGTLSSRSIISLLGFDAGSSINATHATGLDIPVETWHHLAVVKYTARHMAVYFNGKRVCNNSAMPVVMQTKDSANSPLQVGGGYQGSDTKHRSIDGNIDELRYTTGIARYTSESFTLATEAFTYRTCFDGNVVFLTGFQGTGQGATDITDATGKSVSVTLGVAVSVNPPVGFTSYVGAFDGTGCRLSCDSDPDFDLSIADTTLEMWLWPNTNGSLGGLSATSVLVQIGDNSITNNYRVMFNGDASPKLRVTGYRNSAVFDIVSSDISLSAGTWTHAVVERWDNVYRIYLNGVQQGINTLTDTYTISQGKLYIGSDSAFAKSYYGYMDDVRLTKNGARFKGDFVVTTRSLPYRPEYE